MTRFYLSNSFSVLLGSIVLLMPCKAFAERPSFRDRCNISLADKICVVDQSEENKNISKTESGTDYFLRKKYQELKCTPDSHHYGDKIQSVVARFPGFLKEAMCSLRRIYIFPDYGQAISAQISPHYNLDLNEAVKKGAGFSPEAQSLHFRMDGFILSVKEAALLSGFELPRKSTREFDLPPEIYSVIGTRKNTSSGLFALEGLLIHELGHVVDIVNQVTQEKPEDQWTIVDGNNKSECGIFTCFVRDKLKSKWNAISWVNAEAESGWKVNVPLMGPEISSLYVDVILPLFKNLHTLNANSSPRLTRPPERLPKEPMFRAFEKGHFITLYSMTNPLEDWAEHFTSYVLQKMYPQQMPIDGGLGFDLKRLEKESNLFQKKMQLVSSILEDERLKFEFNEDPDCSQCISRLAEIKESGSIVYYSSQDSEAQWGKIAGYLFSRGGYVNRP